MRHERTRTDGRACPTLKNPEISPHLVQHSRLIFFFLVLETPDEPLRGCSTREADISDTSIVQPTEHPRTSPAGQNTCLDIPLAGVCRSYLCREQ